MPGPEKFGDKTTWIKGHLTGRTGPFFYFDLYKCEAIRRDNEDDYTLRINGMLVELIDCTVHYDLAEIAPGA